jgi:RNA polymerase sigma-70 factor, ECF subfamily
LPARAAARNRAHRRHATHRGCASTLDSGRPGADRPRARARPLWQPLDQRRDILVGFIGIERHAVHDPADRQHDIADTSSADIGLRIDLVAALQRLTREQRQSLLLVALEQVSYAECAEAPHVPIGTVMSRISRGRVALRARLDGELLPERRADALRVAHRPSPMRRDPRVPPVPYRPVLRMCR